ncbi:SPOR domain-containing protein [Caminibacter mediatlanticus]|nr:SPOR domain-containing protein [Caminibacter mediatlanticus]
MMYRSIIFLILFVHLFSFQLAIDVKEKQLLNNCGIDCRVIRNYCIILDSANKDNLIMTKYYLQKEYGIDSFILDKDIQLSKKVIKKNTSDSKSLKNKTNSNNFLPQKKLINIYSYQVVSIKNLVMAKQIFKKIKNNRYARIEKIKNYYVVRFGIYYSYKDAKKDLSKYKNLNPLLIKCYFIPSRVIE